MQHRDIGSYETTSIGGEQIRAFVPASLPPNPALVLDGSLQQVLEAAVLALGRLDGITAHLRTKHFFCTLTYVRKRCLPPRSREHNHSCLTCYSLSWMKYLAFCLTTRLKF